MKQQQQSLQQPSSSNSDSAGGGAQSWARGRIGSGVQHLTGGGLVAARSLGAGAVWATEYGR